MSTSYMIARKVINEKKILKTLQEMYQNETKNSHNQVKKKLNYLNETADN